MSIHGARALKVAALSEHEELFAMQLKALKLQGWMRELVFAPPRRWRFDFANPELMLAVEIEGGTWVNGAHTRGAHFEQDCMKYNAAILHGWRVLRGTSEMVADGRLLRSVEEITTYLRGAR